MNTPAPRAPYVFVVNLPMRFDVRLQDWRPNVDISAAASFGDLVFLTQHGAPPRDRTLALPRMAEFLERFTSNDYLLPLGPPVYMCWAAAMAVHKTGGRLKVLVWQSGGTYDVVDANLYVLPPTVYDQPED